MRRYMPLQVVIELTKQCNLHCWHCGSSCDYEVDPDELTIEEWKGVIDQLVKLGTKKVVFSGGEPTLKPNFDRLIAHVAKNGLEYSLITNGYDVPHRIIKAISVFRPYAVGVSLDGNEAIHNTVRSMHDSWDRSIKLIRTLKERDHQVCAVTTVAKWNQNALDGLVKILSGLVDSWQIQLASPFGRMKLQEKSLISEEEFQYLCRRIIMYRDLYPELYIQAADCFGMAPAGSIRSEKWSGCSAGLWSMGIDACGFVVPCLSIQNERNGGNVKDAPVGQIWEYSPYIGINRGFKPEYAIGGKCEGCSQIDDCRGGCASMSQAYYGDFHMSPFCYFRSFEKNIQKGW